MVISLTQQSILSLIMFLLDLSYQQMLISTTRRIYQMLNKRNRRFMNMSRECVKSRHLLLNDLSHLYMVKYMERARRCSLLLLFQLPFGILRLFVSYMRKNARINGIQNMKKLRFMLYIVTVKGMNHVHQ